MNLEQTIHLLKQQLTEAYRQYGRLNHPQVVKISQQLDRVLNRLTRKSLSPPSCPSYSPTGFLENR